MYLKSFNNKILVLLSGLILVTSCGAKREAVINEPNDIQYEVSDRQKRQFDRYFFDGLREKIIGNYDRAEQNFLRAHRINKNNAAVQYELALLYYQGELFYEALPYARQSVRLEDTNLWYNKLYAGILEELKKYNEAVRIYNKLIKLQADNIELYIDKATLQLLSGKYKEAIETFDETEERFGYDNKLGYRKFRVFLEMDQLDNATNELRKLSRYYPTELYYKTLLADVFLTHEKENEAFEVYQDILKLDPENGRVQLALANFYLRQNQRDSAMYYYKIAFNNHTLDIDSKIRVLYVLYLANDFDPEYSEEAFELCEILIHVHPEEAKAFALYGDLLYQDDQLEKAKSNYLKSIELNKSIYAVWQNILYIYFELKEYEKLIDIADEILIYFPNQAFTYFLSGFAHSQLEQYTMAISMFESALILITDNDRFLSEIHGSIADVYYILDDYEKCDLHFETSLKLNPDNATALNNYSYYLALRKEKLDEAKKMSARSLELEPDNASFLDTYGWIMYNKGNFEEAKKWISKAWEKSPESSEIASHYGDVLYRLGRIEDAISFWEIAITLGGDEEILRKKIENKTIYEK